MADESDGDETEVSEVRAQVEQNCQLSVIFGSFEKDILKEQSNVVRIFISSTFTGIYFVLPLIIETTSCVIDSAFEVGLFKRSIFILKQLVIVQSNVFKHVTKLSLYSDLHGKSFSGIL